MRIAIEAGGNSFPKKEGLKAMGCKWLPQQKCWVWFGEDSRMIEISQEIEAMGLEPFLRIETEKMTIFQHDDIYYQPGSDFPQGSPEWELGRKFYEEF